MFKIFKVRIFFIFSLSLTLSLVSFAGPLTNKEEYEADTWLTEQEKADYTKKLEQGIKYFEAAEYNKAELEFKKILVFAPKKTLAYFNLGLTKYKQEDYPAAIKNFDTVIKMKSYYVGAAIYYRAIAQLNLGDEEGALKTAKRFTEARFFYAEAQNLLKAIETGSDEYFENAKAAFADTNYELCLLEMGASVLADTKKGRELTQKCKDGVAFEAAKVAAAPAIVEMAPANNFATKFHFDARIGKTDNIYQAANVAEAKTIYSTEVGAELNWRGDFETGLGAFYNQANALKIENFKDETTGVYIPLNFRFGQQRIYFEPFYNSNKLAGINSYTDSGLYLTYLFSTENYLLGVSASNHSKKALHSWYNYKNGDYSSLRLFANRYLDKLTLNGHLGYEINASADQDWGTFKLPYANTTTKLGVGLTYELNPNSELSLASQIAELNFTHELSAKAILRKDHFNNLLFKYLYKVQKNVSIFMSQNIIKNKSNYDDSEGVNRNYVEHLTRLGLLVATY